MSPIYRILGLCLLAQYLTNCHPMQPLAITSVSPPISSSMLPLMNVTSGEFEVENSTLEELGRDVQNGISRWKGSPHNVQNSTSPWGWLTEPFSHVSDYFLKTKNPSLDQLDQALYEAVQRTGTGNQRVNEVGSLRAKGARMNVLQPDGSTAFSIAASKAIEDGDMRVLKELLRPPKKRIEKSNICIGAIYIADYNTTYPSMYVLSDKVYNDFPIDIKDYWRYHPDYSSKTDALAHYYTTLNKIIKVIKMVNPTLKNAATLACPED